MFENVILVKNEKGYTTSNGVKMYFPDVTLQSKLEKYDTPILLMKNVVISTEKDTYGFISGDVITNSSKISTKALTDYIIADKDYDYISLVRLTSPTIECVLATKSIVGEPNISFILADIGNGLEVFNTISAMGNASFLHNMYRKYIPNLKRIDITIYAEQAKLAQLAKNAIYLSYDEMLYLSAYLYLSNSNNKSSDFEIIDNKYVRYNRRICFRLNDEWLRGCSDCLYLLDNMTTTNTISRETVEDYIIKNMLVYSNLTDEKIVQKAIRYTDEYIEYIDCINIYNTTYYDLQAGTDVYSKINQSKDAVLLLRKQIGKYSNKSNLELLQKTTYRKILNLD